MTDFELRALKLLVEQTKDRRLVRPGWFGSCLWPKTRRPTWAFARPAGNVLNRLRAKGLAEWLAPSREEFGWRATDMGRVAATRTPQEGKDT